MDNSRTAYRLSWRDHGDSLDVALLANRIARRGQPVHWHERCVGEFEGGDYCVELPSRSAVALAALGFTLQPVSTSCAERGRAIGHPATALLCGEVSAYPYFGFYTLCLFRLGYTYRSVSGADIAAGALADRDLFVLPGGFATWGLDHGESAPGADAEVRAFLNAGGGCIGSCGGAFYLSAGRPGWTGTLAAIPRWTHEYLQSGAAVVRVELPDDPLRAGLPPTLELPYYHGPVYEQSDLDALIAATGDNTLAVAGHFRAPCLPSRLMIDNPLSADRFERTHNGRVAIIRSQGRRGRAVLFSPHPEMGDLMRKYMSLDGYVRRYLPVRGEKTMDETLRFYRAGESPSFRLVNNAVHWLDTGTAKSAPVCPASAAPGSIDALAASVQQHLSRREPDPDPGLEKLIAKEASRLQARLDAVIPPLNTAITAADGEFMAAFDHLRAEAMRALRDPASSEPASRTLFDAEMVIAIAEAALRLAAVDEALDSV